MSGLAQRVDQVRGAEVQVPERDHVLLPDRGEGSQGLLEAQRHLLAHEARPALGAEQRPGARFEIEVTSKPAYGGSEVRETLLHFIDTWNGTDYDVLRHNCCAFADALCQALGVNSAIPECTGITQIDLVASEAMPSATSQEIYCFGTDILKVS